MKRMQMMVAVGFILVATAGAQDTRTWTGLGSDNLASTTANWSDNTLPTSTDHIVLNSTTNKNMTWNGGVGGLPDTVASWTQATNYTGTVTIRTLYGAAGFTNFTVTGNVTLERGSWTHDQNAAAETYRLRVTIGGNLLVTNAVIHADSKGYTSRTAASPGFLDNHGGVYGGVAQRVDNHGVTDGSFNTRVYGSVTAPTHLGSPGYSAGGTGSGGGAILLTVTGTTTVNAGGFIRADGGLGGGGTGAGSGGSVYLITGFLKGAGTIRAQGGNNGWDRGAAGSGGRVAVILDGEEADFSGWSGTTTAFGGRMTGGGHASSFAAAAGTVYRRAADGTDTLIIDGNNYWPGHDLRIIYSSRVTTLMPPAPNAVDLNAFSQVEIKRRGQLGVGASTTLNFGTFAPTTYGAAASYIAMHNDTGVTYPADWTINGYTLFVNTIATDKNLTNITIGATGALSHFQNANSETHKLNLTIPGNLTIQAGGAINADDRGYLRWGPGHLNDDYAAAHGGTALQSSSGGGLALVNPRVYGSIFNPVRPGSRGNANEASAGGVVILTVHGTTHVTSPGRISVNANGGNRPGSGGSILLRTGKLTGDGTIQAHGCSVTWNNGVGGGGGRIAVYLTGKDEDFSGWTGAITAYGGTANSSPMPRRHGAAGTVYRQLEVQADGTGTVTVDNTTRAKNEAMTTLPAFAASTEDIIGTVWTTANNARIGLVTNAVIESLVLNTGGELALNGWTLNVTTLTVTGTAYPNGTYTPVEISLLTDNVGNGKVIAFLPPPGTLFLLR